ncbi:Fe-S protein assembly co-chaperone HscB [Xylariaceae sp. FL0255]|nr:Fe-S protein assembly co-chaperone HscB [Xylariaceae sp. FL0255]
MRSSIATRRICAICRPSSAQRIMTAQNIYTSPSITTAAPQATIARPTSIASAGRRHFTRSATAPTASTSSPPSSTASNETAQSHSPVEPPKTHYDFFPQTLPQGPPPAGPFAIDTRALRREFLALQAQAHPDLHPSHLKSRAEATSARINEAYRTLESPLSRACYVLHLVCNRDVANDETAKVDDAELLMLVLETREAIEEADSEEELEPVRLENEERIRECEERLGDLFAHIGDREATTEEEEEAVQEVVRLRYWVNVRESIRNWERGKPVVLEH